MHQCLNYMKIKTFLFVFRMLCLALPVAAQQPDAKDILDRAAGAFRSAGGVEITFSVRAPEGNSTGTIRLKGDKFLLKTEGVTTWFDGRTQWTYLASSDEVNVSEPTQEELKGINPYSWLSLYDQDYKLKVAKTGNASDNITHKVVMTATKRSRDIQCVILYIDRRSFLPLKLSMVRRGSKEAVVVFINSCRTGERYGDSLFVFDRKDYPTAEIVDLR